MVEHVLLSEQIEPVVMSRGALDTVGLVKKQFSDPENVRAYSTVELFLAEEKLIDKYFKTGSSVLDIGCGAGRTTIHLAKKGYDVVGIDLVPEMIEAAKRQAERQRVNVRFDVMDAVTMTFHRESFDNVLFAYNGFDQIQGSRNRERVLCNVFEIIKPGGYFMMTTRSAFGRRTLTWGLIAALFLQHKLIKRNAEWELGDKIWNGQYYHYINPCRTKALLRDIGYELVYFNSEKRIVNKKPSTMTTNFSGDRMLFYVARKNAVDA
jgi:2-polyprenyl-3-methyl-5-hydroxy-6-metoxy-1,4-benzoquinol methylase